MFQTVLNKLPRRLLFSFIIALVGGLLLELVLKLQYRNFEMLRSPEWYIGSILLTILYIELIFQLNRWFDSIVKWGRRPVLRFNLQMISYWLIAIAVFNGLRLVYVVFFSSKQFILFVDEVTIALFSAIAIFMLNIIDFGLILMRQSRDSLAQAEKYKKESAEFEFEMLQAQINPHFLFNSLNTLSSLVYEDADRSAEFIRKLSDVYRHVLDARQKDLISLREELSFIESYIFLLELRFENKLKIDVRIDENLLDQKIAPLTLQLLIENAVKHNIASDSKPLSVDIYNDADHIIVENPLHPKTVKEKGNNMGLRNISSRYNALCGNEVGIYNTYGAFTVKIPII